MTRVPFALSVLLPMVLAGCGYQEGLLIQNLRGRVFIPKDAVTRDVVRADGSTETIGPDIKLLGPVYLGLYPSVFEANVIERYPHPEIGPQFLDDVQGDAYPYGGTTIGDLRFSCLEFLTCKVTSGRFLDYQELIDWFKLVEQPITDAAGAEVTDSSFLQQTCYDLLNATSDDEVRITAYEDRNEDGTIDRGDLDFIEEGDFYVGEFTLWQQEHFSDSNQENCTPGEDCTGFSLWGWMDAPSEGRYQFASCDETAGYQNTLYNADFFGGAPYTNLLNFPSTYITPGDWVATEGYVWSDIYDQPDLYIDFPVQ